MSRSLKGKNIFLLSGLYI